MNKNRNKHLLDQTFYVLVFILFIFINVIWLLLGVFIWIGIEIAGRIYDYVHHLILIKFKKTDRAPHVSN